MDRATYGADEASRIGECQNTVEPVCWHRPDDALKGVELMDNRDPVDGAASSGTECSSFPKELSKYVPRKETEIDWQRMMDTCRGSGGGEWFDGGFLLFEQRNISSLVCDEEDVVLWTSVLSY